ncbi:MULTISPECIES: hypothetical protein [unclassified Enterococcus]|uniref:hypothetical protein n=1 Tax=unclassified Enterococcus TaxID=2608891 RepID=UPI0015516BB9|nr:MULTISPECIES: hypothetical protein [unclassified Enterococcus]MBS7577600.1 hypothetical protein [Enterococcus sp. MMGLQ5-2]MBS7584901.1 hypothetical protein [Enterococcus sp. MMGLQ5-1]NPD12756.1 hypothetical protein [Enterococcus sp. MMGLQ5-1]NPD37433.1 hypothetical protein [Enterococcus sp. MMGLQ5-2]
MLDIKNQIIRLKWSSFGSYSLAAGKLILAIFSLSFFLLINALYTAIVGYGKHQSVIGLTSPQKHNQLWYYKRIGSLIMGASLVYMLYSTRLFINHQEIYFEQTPALAIAAITFTEIVVSLRGIIKAHQNKDLILKAVKLLNFSAALIGLVLTQAALLSFSEKQVYAIPNAILGLFLGTITLAIGLKMATKSKVETTKPKTVKIAHSLLSKTRKIGNRIGGQFTRFINKQFHKVLLIKSPHLKANRKKNKVRKSKK